MKLSQQWLRWTAIALVLVLAGIGVASMVAPFAQPVALAAATQQVVPVSAPAAGSLASLDTSFEDLYVKVNPSVVNIHVVQGTTAAATTGRQNPFGFGNRTPQNAVPQEALGSGFVWDNQGDIVTNNHVVDQASRISVTFADGSTVDAKLVGADLYSDLAVIKVNVPAAKLVPLAVADSTQVRVGQIVIAIGNPFGLQGTMTQGIISGLGRTLPAGSDSGASTSTGSYSIPDVIQTDASINPGNSGGPLVDLNGRLVGVTSAIESPSGANAGVGFVIPSSIVQKTVPVLMSTGSVKHAWLGLSGSTLTPDLAKAAGLDAAQQGALVATVTAGGPSDKAGVHASDQQTTVNGQQVPSGGDVITAINGQPVKRFDDVISYLFSSTEPGQTITLTVLRQGHEQQLKVTLGERPAQ